MAHTGMLVSRDLLLDRVWGLEYPGGTRTVDVHVAQLRRKLGRPDLIRTLRGAGLQGRRASEQPAGAAVRSDARSACPDARADDRHRRGAHAPPGRPKSQVTALARAPTTSRCSGGANVSYVNQNTLSGSVRILVEPRAQLARTCANVNKSSDGKTIYDGDHYLYSYRTIPSRGLLLLRPESLRSAEWKPFLRDLLFAALAGAALAAALSFLIARSIARPIRRVADATRALAADERHEPLPQVGTTRGRLARAGVQRDGRAACRPRARPSATSCSRSATS